MNHRQLITGVPIFVTAALLPVSAMAHHFMGGNTPSSFYEGILSGIAHPVIGVDHLAFIICAGLLATIIGRRFTLPLVFVIGTLAGTALHLASFDFPYVEPIILASVAIAGLLIFIRADVSVVWLCLIFSGVGLAHGYAYAETIIGAETTPFAAYLLGFSIIQYVIALVAGSVFTYFSAGDIGRERKYARITGSLVLVLSVYLAATSVFIS